MRAAAMALPAGRPATALFDCQCALAGNATLRGSVRTVAHRSESGAPVCGRGILAHGHLLGLGPPRHPLPKPVHGRYHLNLFVRHDGRIGLFWRGAPGAAGSGPCVRARHRRRGPGAIDGDLGRTRDRSTPVSSAVVILSAMSWHLTTTVYGVHGDESPSTAPRGSRPR
jgi:hypothetical protein